MDHVGRVIPEWKYVSRFMQGSRISADGQLIFDCADMRRRVHVSGFVDDDGVWPHIWDGRERDAQTRATSRARTSRTVKISVGRYFDDSAPGLST